MTSERLQKPVLVLNVSYEPINVCAARRALVLVLKGVASLAGRQGAVAVLAGVPVAHQNILARERPRLPRNPAIFQQADDRSEEHTSELQSRQYLVCRLLL